MKLSLTAIIPTKNEEHHIIDALKSVAFADEIIVIDSYSTDTTVEKIKEFGGVNLLQKKFDDFSSQKNFAIEKAKHNWIFILDADERLNDELKNEITTTLNNPKYEAYWIYRRNYFMGKAINYSGWQKDKVIRLFNKTHCKYEGLVHEEIVCSTNSYGFLKHKIEHHSYTNWEQYIQKQNHYTTLQANNLYKLGKQTNLFHFTVKPCFRFFKHYFLQLGFLDGMRGFIIASIYGYNVLNRYIKLWILNNHSE